MSEPVKSIGTSCPRPTNRQKIPIASIDPIFDSQNYFTNFLINGLTINNCTRSRRSRHESILTRAIGRRVLMKTYFLSRDILKKYRCKRMRVYTNTDLTIDYRIKLEIKISKRIGSMKNYVVTISRLLIAHFSRHACNALSFVQRQSNSTTSAPLCTVSRRERSSEGIYRPLTAHPLTSFLRLRFYERTNEHRRAICLFTLLLYSSLVNFVHNCCTFLSLTTNHARFHVNSIKRNDIIITYMRLFHFSYFIFFVYFFFSLSFNRYHHFLRLP